MNIVRAAYPLLDDVRHAVPSGGQTMAIGDFDGVHLGHREVLGRAIAKAQSLGVPASVMTFSPHPREVLGSPVYSDWITPLPTKLALFEQLGMDTVYVFAFDKTFAALPPDAFVTDVLQPLGVKGVAVGFNFTFGRGGSGTSALLKELGADSFTVDIVEPKLVDGERVSSTSIREALRAGNVARASDFLGRPFTVSGFVVAGEGRGRTIGVPTANLAIPERCVKPANGVYAVTMSVESGPYNGHTYDGVMNVGVKPTFHASLPEPAWEVHLFAFDGDLYGQKVSVAFHNRIRDERKFPSVDELTAQISHDIAQAKQILGK